MTHYLQPRQVVRVPDRALRSRPAMTATQQREHWNNQPTYLGDLFRVSKTRGDKTLGAVCKLWTHALGWEVRLEINDDLQRSEVFRSQDDVLTAGETRKVAMGEKGLESVTADRRGQAARQSASIMSRTHRARAGGGDVCPEGQDRSPPRVLPPMHWMADADARDEAP